MNERRRNHLNRCIGPAALWLAFAFATTAHADNSDPLQTFRAMDEATFFREVLARFQPQPPPPPARLDDKRAGQRADAEYFAAFPRYDRSYSSKSRTEAQRLADRLRVEAGDLTREQFILRVAEIAALADNSHTTLDNAVFKMAAPRIPLRTYLFADGLHVLHATPANADLLGARIDRIDGRSIDSLYRVLRRYNGGLEVWRRRQLIPLLESPSLLHAAGLARAADQIVISGVTASGVRFERSLVADERLTRAASGLTQRLLYPQRLREAGMVSLLENRSDLPASLRNGEHFLGSESVGTNGRYVRVDLTIDIDQPIQPFLAEVLEQVRREQPKFVVIDLRMNQGGDSNKTYEFTQRLPAAAAGAHIYVLTSPWTRSAAMYTAAALKTKGGKQVTLVGENVADPLDFWSEGAVLRLPNTGISVDYTAGRHILDGSCRDLDQCFWLDFVYPVKVRSLAPDIRAPWTFSDYAQGRDPALAAVLKLEENGR